MMRRKTEQVEPAKDKVTVDSKANPVEKKLNTNHGFEIERKKYI